MARIGAAYITMIGGCTTIGTVYGFATGAKMGVTKALTRESYNCINVVHAAIFGAMDNGFRVGSGVFVFILFAPITVPVSCYALVRYQLEKLVRHQLEKPDK